MHGASLRILIADDDPLVRMIMVTALQDAGFEVLEASDGAEACQLAENPDNVALIITDLNMPNADGIAVANWARRHHPNMPVLFVSGRPDLLKALPQPYRYLSKPFSVEQLAKTVDQLLNNR